MCNFVAFLIHFPEVSLISNTDSFQVMDFLMMSSTEYHALVISIHASAGRQVS
jgi:hypothetical protein